MPNSDRIEEMADDAGRTLADAGAGQAVKPKASGSKAKGPKAPSGRVPRKSAPAAGTGRSKGTKATKAKGSKAPSKRVPRKSGPAAGAGKAKARQQAAGPKADRPKAMPNAESTIRHGEADSAPVVSAEPIHAAEAAAAVPRTDLEACLHEIVLPGILSGYPFVVTTGEMIAADARPQRKSAITRQRMARSEDDDGEFGGSDLQAQDLMDQAERLARLQGLAFVNTREQPMNLVGLNPYKGLEPAIRYLKWNQKVAMPKGPAWQSSPTSRDSGLGMVLVLPLGEGPLQPMDYIICQDLTQRLVRRGALTVVGAVRPRWASRKESSKVVNNEVLVLEVYDASGAVLFRNPMLTPAQALQDFVHQRVVQEGRRTEAERRLVAAEALRPRPIADIPAPAPISVPVAVDPMDQGAPLPDPEAPARASKRARTPRPAIEPKTPPAPAPLAPVAPSQARAQLLGAERAALLAGHPDPAAVPVPVHAAVPVPPSVPVRPATHVGEGVGATELSRRLGQSNEIIKSRVEAFIESCQAGAALSDLLGFLGVPPGDPNEKGIRNHLGRIIDKLQGEGRVRAQGARRWVRYFHV